MARKVVVIGAGPGGYVAAIRSAQLGAEVTCVENRYLGGCCLNVGCIPTKAMLACTETLLACRGAADYGVKLSGKVEPMLPAMKKRKDKVVRTLTGGVGQLFKANGIKHVEGTARLAARNKVSVETPKGTTELPADAVIVATGSEPARPSFLPWDSGVVLDSTAMLQLTEIPKRLLVIGGGYIGCEFACIYAELGAEVTVVEMLPHLLPMEDEEISALLEREFKKKGVKIITGRKIDKVEAKGKSASVSIQGGEKIEADAVLAAMGRSLNSRNLGLAEIGVKIDNGAVVTNDRMETSAPGVFAVGDVTGGALLAHKASAEGLTAAANACGRNARMDYKVVPSAVYTHPEVARVGLTEADARKTVKEVKVGRFQYRASGKALAVGHTEGIVKAVADAHTHEILGVSIVGSHAADIIAEAGVAMNLEALAEDIAHTQHPHPSLSEAVMEACEDLLGHAIHVPPGK